MTPLQAILSNLVIVNTSHLRCTDGLNVWRVEDDAPTGHLVQFGHCKYESLTVYRRAERMTSWGWPPDWPSCPGWACTFGHCASRRHSILSRHIIHMTYTYTHWPVLTHKRMHILSITELRYIDERVLNLRLTVGVLGTNECKHKYVPKSSATMNIICGGLAATKRTRWTSTTMVRRGRDDSWNWRHDAVWSCYNVYMVIWLK